MRKSVPGEYIFYSVCVGIGIANVFVLLTDEILRAVYRHPVASSYPWDFPVMFCSWVVFAASWILTYLLLKRGWERKHAAADPRDGRAELIGDETR